jgi:hypothetical protein
MNYTAAVRDTWRHHDLGEAKHNYLNLVRYATLAASSHNTQPWKFKLEPGAILILPDLSRRCAQVDPDDHHLYGSLGCATANLLLAAQAAGLRGHVACDEAASCMQVDFEEAPALRSALFDAIPKRQCSRAEFDFSPLKFEQLRQLQDSASGNGVSVLLFTGSKHMEQIAEYVTQGNNAQFGDPRWQEELRQWIRFNRREAVRTGDGLYGGVMGMPDLPQWMGNLALPFALSAQRQNRKDVAHIRSSAAIAVLVSEANDHRHWIEAGQCYQRLALHAAAMGLSTAFINQPVEVPALRAQFAAFLGIGGRRPDLVIRIGRGPEMPRSLRRPVAEVLV